MRAVGTGHLAVGGRGVGGELVRMEITIPKPAFRALCVTIEQHGAE